MKYCSLIVLLFIFSCQRTNEALQDTKEWNIQLKTFLANISIMLPEEYDTSFEWIHHTDYERGAEYKIRMQPKNYPVNMESGFMWDNLQDTVHQFTVAYGKYPDADTTYEYKPDKYFRDQLLWETKMMGRKYNWIDTIRSLDHHLMLAFSYEEEGKKNVRSQILEAHTYHKGQWVSFEFVSRMPCNSSDSDFATKSLESVKTINFSKH